MFSAIGSALGRVFGTNKAAGELINHVSSGLDKLIYTGEEKAEDHAKSVTESRRMVIEWLRNTQGQNLARRIIALSIVFSWLSMYGCMVICNFLSIWIISRVEQLAESAEMMGGYAKDMNAAVMLILAFYFAAPHMGKFVENALGRFQDK